MSIVPTSMELWGGNVHNLEMSVTEKCTYILCIYIYYLIGEKVIWLDIARVCGRIFTSRR